MTTVVDAGSTGLRLTQVDSYVTGDNFYLSEITVSNSGASTQTASLYHAADCFLAGTDNGYGYVQGANAVFCAANANNSPAGRILGFEPADAASSGATYLENRFNLDWGAINGSPFANLLRLHHVPRQRRRPRVGYLDPGGRPGHPAGPYHPLRAAADLDRRPQRD